MSSDRSAGDILAHYRAAEAVLDATVETVDAEGAERKIPLAEFHRLPGDEPQRDTNLRPGELITAVTLPVDAGMTQY